MKKDDLIVEVSKEMETTKIQTKQFLEAFINKILETLNKGEEVNLIGFGHFKIVKSNLKVLKNMQTGEYYKVPEGKKVKFVMGKTLKNSIKRY